MADPANNGVSASAPEKLAVLSMTALPRTIQSPEEYLYNYLKVPALSQGVVISPSRLQGFTGIQTDPNTKQRSRIAVIYYKLNAYIFQGEVVDDAEFEDYDVLFLDAINTFRPISRAEIVGQKPRVVNYIKASATTTYEILGKSLRLNSVDIDTLRVINGHYPSGEPQEGDWIKILSNKFRREIHINEWVDHGSQQTFSAQTIIKIVIFGVLIGAIVWSVFGQKETNDIDQNYGTDLSPSTSVLKQQVIDILNQKINSELRLTIMILRFPVIRHLWK